MAVPSKVIELVERFGRDLDLYKRADYKEARVRVEFIDPFFEALGWDVRNVGGKREHTKDVIREDAISIAGKTRAPDYSFRVGGARKFFLEAKKPSVDLKDNIGPAYQLRRYSWSVKLPLGILTDFEEFTVYDCRQSPKATDSANVGQLLYVTFDQYLDHFDEIHGLFAKESVQGGSLDQFVGAIKGKRGTSEVDKELLKEIEGWRDVLARNIALRNEHLSVHELNFAVQRTIDRVLFLRIAEDRGIEIYGNLRDLVSTPEIYPRLKVLYKQADEKYNAGLFDFKADTLTPGLSIDDKVLKPILENLYYPKSPYEFSVMPVEILGQVYEQFLGKVIRLTPSHRAKVEEKPEVKKAGGVYYTPSYIVDYIVKQTVGKLIEGKSPKQVSKMRILDPACGSGSFLLGAFQYLLDYHLEWYEDHDPSSHANKKQPAVYQGTRGEWRLTSVEKKRILINNIYGVDIDRQAVEVTKLSLLLKVLEGETEESLGQQLSLWRERALPNLGENIKCGNSLIGPDFFEAQLMPNEAELRSVNPFDWQAEFPEVMVVGGFDIVIGNPPYGFHQIHSEFVKPYYKKQFAASQGSFEHYFLFYERSIKLLKKNGVHGFIVPVTWLTIPSARSLRKLILDNYWIREICWLPELVFHDAQVNTLISIIQNSPGSKVIVEIYDTLGFREPPIEERFYDQSRFTHSDYYIGIFEKEVDSEILQKMSGLSQPLKDIARPCSGYNPYERGKGQSPLGGSHTKETIMTKPYHSEIKLGDEWKPEIVGRNLGRYSLDITGKRWIKYGPWLVFCCA
jgi:type I restriction-modification system DNA methylase subunit